jgi:hypothetical protein
VEVWGVSRWNNIKTIEFNPNGGTDEILLYAEGSIIMDSIYKNDWENSDDLITLPDSGTFYKAEITHWMPLPEPPNDNT